MKDPYYYFIDYVFIFNLNEYEVKQEFIILVGDSTSILRKSQEIKGRGLQFLTFIQIVEAKRTTLLCENVALHDLKWGGW